jgi:hypothetical protein
LDRLKADLNAKAQSIAHHYLGEPRKYAKNQLQYGTKKGSLFVTLTGAKQGFWYDFQTGIGGDMLAFIVEQTGADFKSALKEATDFLGGRSPYQKAMDTPENQAIRQRKEQEALAFSAREQAKKLAHVADIAKGTQAIKGTLAEKYLIQHRAINQPLNKDNLRFHPALKNWSNGQTYPALVVLVHDEKNQLVGLQATFLDPTTAHKATLKTGNNKLSRGTISLGATVNHAITDNPNPPIALAEGLETALSVAKAHPDWEVKLTFGVSNFEKVALASKRSNVIICADNDGLESGTAKAVQKAVDNLATQHIAAQVVLPTKPQGIEKWDFNDRLKKEGVQAVKDDLDSFFTEQLDNIIENRSLVAKATEQVDTEKTLAQSLITYIETEQAHANAFYNYQCIRSGKDLDATMEAKDKASLLNDNLREQAFMLNQQEEVKGLIKAARDRFIFFDKVKLDEIKIHLEQGNMDLHVIYPLLSTIKQKTANTMAIKQQLSRSRKR